MKAKIHYHEIGDYLSRENKLRIIREFGSVEHIPWTILQSNEHGDWINHRNEWKFSQTNCLHLQKIGVKDGKWICLPHGP